MDEKVAIRVDGVSKKYCRSLRRSMLYGLADIGRNLLGRSSRPERLRSGEFWALDGLSLEVDRGQCLGIIGRNGSGKTTLLKLLNGVFWPDKGRIEVRGRTGALIEVGAGFHPLLTGRENIFVNAAILGMTRQQAQQRFDQIVTFAGVEEFLDAPVKNYSSGMYVRLGFAVAAHCQPDILLVDEVLAVGDTEFQARCFDRIGELRRDGTTIVIVSHNMHTISGFTESALLLQRGKGRYFSNVADAVSEYGRSFSGGDTGEIERICSGGKGIDFYRVDVPPRVVEPGADLEVTLSYRAAEAYKDVDVDTVILSGNETGFYSQVSSKALGKRVDLPAGEHCLRVRVHSVAAMNALCKLVIAIWRPRREGYLFWWRIPVRFIEVPGATGRNFLPVTYEIDPPSQGVREE